MPRGFAILFTFSVLPLILAPYGGDGAVTTAGEVLFISSTEDGLVVRIDLPSLAATTIASGLESAEGIACGPDDRLYVTQSSVYGGPRRIVSLAFDGSDFRIDLDFGAEPLLAGSGGPEGPAFGPDGALFFNTNPSGGPSTGTWKLPPVGSPVQVIPPFSNYSEAIVFPKAGPFAGHLLLVDNEHERVLRRPPPFTSAERALEFITGQITSPNGFAEDSAGNLYVVNIFGPINRFSTDGTFLGEFVDTGYYQRKIAFDGSDNAYVATVGGPVFRITPSGAMEIVGSVPGGNGVAVCREGPESPPPCPRSHGFWKTHPAEWPVTSLDLGDRTYNRPALLDLLGAPSRSDASVILARQLIAAELNVASGTDSGPVSGVLEEAHRALESVGPVPAGTRPSSPAGHYLVSLADALDDYNNRRLTQGC